MGGGVAVGRTAGMWIAGGWRVVVKNGEGGGEGEGGSGGGEEGGRVSRVLVHGCIGAL